MPKLFYLLHQKPNTTVLCTGLTKTTPFIIAPAMKLGGEGELHIIHVQLFIKVTCLHIVHVHVFIKITCLHTYSTCPGLHQDNMSAYSTCPGLHQYQSQLVHINKIITTVSVISSGSNHSFAIKCTLLVDYHKQDIL